MAEPDLVISAGFSDAQLVKEANKIVALYAKKGQEAQKAFVDAQGKVPTNQVVNAHMKELDRLKKAYDPAYAAAQKYKAEVEKLDRALKTGAITQDQYTAQVTKSAKAMQAAGASVEQAASRSYGGIQNLSFQVQDFAVQVANGTAASTALGQQLPQLLGGFGALGAVMGAVVAVGVPLAAMFLSSEEEAVDLDKTVKELTASLETLREAQVNAAIPLDALIEKYGALGDEMAEVYANQLAIAAKELENLGKATLSALEDVAGMSDMVASLEALKTASENGGLSYQEYLAALRDLENQFGLTIAQALQWEGLMESVASAAGPEAQAQAWLEVNNWLVANRDELEAQGVNVDDLTKKANELAGEYANAHLAAADTAAAAEAGAVATANWDAAAANLVASFNAAGAAARNAAAQVGALIAQQNAANGMQLGQLGGMDVFSPSSGRVITGLGGGNPLATPYAAPDFKPVRGGGGGRKSSKSGGSSAADKAAAKAEGDEIKRIYDDVKLAIKAAEEEAEKFNDAMGQIGDTIADVIFEGESLRDSLAGIFKGIASDILSSGIRNALVSQFGAGGASSGFGSFLGDVFGGFRANGGDVDPSKAYVVGERGPEMFVPPSAGVIVPNHKLGGGGSSSVSLSIDLRGTSGDKELDSKIARAGQAILAQVPSVMNNNQKRRG